jgi:predicted metal-dependent hydrolase
MSLIFTRARQKPLPSHLDIIHGEATYRVAVKRMAKARRFTLRVLAATRVVTLTMPIRSSFDQAVDFASRHGGWIADRLNKFDDHVQIAPNAEIPFRGVPHRIIHRGEKRGTVSVERDEQDSPHLIVAGRVDHAPRRVRDFLKKEARLALDQAVERYTKILGIPARRIALKDTRSRWGSCSADGRLNFSWRLIFAPPEILEYLAAHEVAHLKELNHSPRFWSIVASLYPDYKKAEAWLKRHGASLHRYI